MSGNDKVFGSGMEVKFSYVKTESYCHPRTCAHYLGFVISLFPFFLVL